jgi:hypothetical protein
MQYLLLIHDNEQQWEKLSPAEMQQVMKEFRDYGDLLKQGGHYVLGHQLQPSTTAKSLRTRNGKLETMDGPFAETKEQLGGFYLIAANDIAEATALAARCPGSRYGTVEVRAVVPNR